MRNILSPAVTVIRRCPGEQSPGILFLLWAFLLCLMGTAQAAEPLFGQDEPFSVPGGAAGAALSQPLFRILYVAGSHGALHPCPS